MRMKEQDVIEVGRYLVDNKSTVRKTGDKFGISKSTIHKNLTHKLKDYDYTLYKQVIIVLDENKQERHIRGGEATKAKFSKNILVKI